MKKPASNGNQIIIGAGWYSREQWHRLCELADDKEALDDSYEDWLEGWNEFMTNTDRRAVKIEVSVDELAWWCQSKNRPLDANARAAFVTAKVAQLAESSSALNYRE